MTTASAKRPPRPERELTQLFVRLGFGTSDNYLAAIIVHTMHGMRRRDGIGVKKTREEFPRYAPTDSRPI